MKRAGGERLLTRRAFVTLLMSAGVGALSGRGLAQAADCGTSATEPRLEHETFALINQYRATQALPDLAWDDGVAEIARAHSRDMATDDIDFGHDGFSDRVHRVKAIIPGVRGCGENVFMSDPSNDMAQKAVELWLKSPHHLENIRGRYSISGLGAWTSDKGQVYLTQFFVDNTPA